MSQQFILPTDKNRERIQGNLIAFIGALSRDKAWRIDIKLFRKDRSEKQNRALFGVAYPAISEVTGFEKDEIHDYMCKEFFGRVKKVMWGKEYEVPFRTTTTDDKGKRDVIDTATFATLYEFIQRRMAEQGIYVPDPEQEVPDAM
jgi:hypothetical protein